MNIRTLSLVSLFSLSLTCLCLAACGSVSPDPPAQGGAAGFCCPKIDETIGTCSNGRILRAALSCGGEKRPVKCEGDAEATPQETVAFSVSTAPGGANRFNVQFMNGSRFQGSMITPDPGCVITQGTDIDFTFGLVYTGDQGVETADGSMRPCIVQSKVVYSSFNFDLVGNFVHEGRIKNLLHETLDSQIINQLFATGGGQSMIGRCQRWREMP